MRETACAENLGGGIGFASGGRINRLAVSTDPVTKCRIIRPFQPKSSHQAPKIHIALKPCRWPKGKRQTAARDNICDRKRSEITVGSLVHHDPAIMFRSTYDSAPDAIKPRD
jgi:hypothetical protein